MDTHWRLTALVLVVLACGDDPDPASVDAPRADAAAATSDAAVDAAVDATVDAACLLPAAGQVGGPCSADTDCNSAPGVNDGTCLRNDVTALELWPAQGYCVTQRGLCTDTTCGVGNVCATVDDPFGSYPVCLPACGSGACVCGPGQLCADTVAGTSIGGASACLPGLASAQDGDPCTSIGDCAAGSTCRFDPLEFPGGQCTRTGCVIGDDTTCDGGHCVDAGAISLGAQDGTVCVDACTVDADCRQADGYRCVDGGAGVGRYCRHPHVGDACTADADCGDVATMECNMVTGIAMCTPRAACLTPGGTLGCPQPGSVCWDGAAPVEPNLCVARCGGPVGTQGGCRSGLVCRDVRPSAAVSLGCVP